MFGYILIANKDSAEINSEKIINNNKYFLSAEIFSLISGLTLLSLSLLVNFIHPVLRIFYYTS